MLYISKPKLSAIAFTPCHHTYVYMYVNVAVGYPWVYEGIEILEIMTIRGGQGPTLALDANMPYAIKDTFAWCTPPI